MLNTLFLILLLNPTIAAELSGRDVMEKQKTLHKVSSESGLEKMLLVDKGGAQEGREVKRYARESEKDVYRGLLVFLEPADIKGTALLNWQHKKASDDQWLYLPAQGKMQRIAEGSKRNNFMGTDLTYEDMQSEELDDYAYSVLKMEKCDAFECYVIEATPKTPEKAKESSYSKRVLWVRKDIFVTTKTEFYDRRNKLLKTSTNYDFENLKGTVWRAKKGIMENHLSGHKTVIMTVSRKVDEDIPEQTFTERFILSGQHTK